MNLTKTITPALNSTRSDIYNKVGHNKKFTRTNFPVSKQFDFMQSVEYRLLIPQI